MNLPDEVVKIVSDIMDDFDFKKTKQLNIMNKGLPDLQKIAEKWRHYKYYLIEILNGDYDLEKAREDLAGLIGSEYDDRIKTQQP